MKMNPKTTIKLRFVVSTFLILLAFVTFLSGFILLQFPKGMGKYGIEKTIFGLEKRDYERIHVISSVLMAFLIVVHLFLNFQMYKNEFNAFR